MINETHWLGALKTLTSRMSVRNCDWDQVRELVGFVPWQVMDTFDDINAMW